MPKLCKRRERLLFGAIVQIARQAVAFLHHRQVFSLLEEFHVGNRDRSTMRQRREYNVLHHRRSNSAL